MLAALTTLSFLAAIWLAAVIVLPMLGESSSKILAAVRGRSLLATERQSPPVAVRISQRSRQRPLRARPEWRAAA
jgi:hypothetical protein